MIVSAIGLAILLWYELTDPERLEPQPNRSFRTCCPQRSSQVSDPPVPGHDKLDSVERLRKIAAFRFRQTLHLLLGFGSGAAIAVALFDMLPQVVALGGPSHISRWFELSSG